MFFGKAASEQVVGVCPNLGFGCCFFDFGANELVFEVVLIILVFAVGQLKMDQVAQCVDEKFLKNEYFRRPQKKY